MDMDEIAVSVVVPTCGRPDLLNRCLEALCQQTLAPARYEIIVVDDKPQPLTAQLVAIWRGRMVHKGPALFYLANTGTHGPAAARNLGWREARAAVVAFTDDDTVPEPAWLECGLAGLTPDAGALCGRVVMPLPGAPTDYERDAGRLETAEFVTANCFCRKQMLSRLNGFDERFRLAWREDSDLHFRLLGAGAEIVHSPEAVVVHPVRPAPWGVSISQQKKVLFDALLYKKHPVLYRQKIRPHPPWDYYAIVAMLLAMLLGVATGGQVLALGGMAGWLLLTTKFCLMRLAGTAKTLSHVAEMIVTSALIPPCSVFWRMAGAWRFRVAFT
jgi:glycosyltransferase involved in cell wall biosynthesis